MLLVDPEKQDDEQIAHMKAAKARVDAALEPLTIQKLTCCNKHYATISTLPATLLIQESGLADPQAENNFESIEKYSERFKKRIRIPT